MKLVMVTWVDARSDDGWVEQTKLDKSLARITTIGYLISKTKKVLCVASSKDKKTGQVSGVMIIPTVCVIACQNIKPPQRK